MKLLEKMEEATARLLLPYTDISREHKQIQ
jgi:hypothetical protein